MTATELFTLITSEPKWYAGFVSPQNASNIKKRFSDGKLEFSTLEKMFNHFGYFLTASWDKPCEHLMTTCDESGNSAFGVHPNTMFAVCSKCGFRP